MFQQSHQQNVLRLHDIKFSYNHFRQFMIGNFCKLRCSFHSHSRDALSYVKSFFFFLNISLSLINLL